MNINYVVRFRGVPAKYVVALETMIHDDIAGYTNRISMESATVEKEKDGAKPRQQKP